MPQANKKFIETVKRTFQSENEAQILDTIKLFKTNGSKEFLELLLNLLDKTKHDAVRRAVLNICSDLHTQEFTPIIVAFVKQMNRPDYASEFIASCWESRLDFSNNLIPFADTFITGSFQTALESFTVIEEAMWQANEDVINETRNYLVNHIDRLSSEKKELFNELIHVLESGKTQNSEDYPEFYPEA